MAVPVATPPPATRVLKAGYTPDYGTLLKSDPIYLSWQAADPTVSAGATRRAAVRALAIQYGGALPAGYRDTYGDLDPATLRQAAANPFSTVAQLRLANQQAQQQLTTGLAARGALHSGELGYGTGQLAQQYGQGLYGAGTQLGLDYGKAVGDYTGAIGDWRGQLPGVISQAEQSVEANPLYRPTDPVMANLVTGWKAKYGQPVYQGPGGATDLYTVDANGNLVAFKPGGGS